MKIFSTAKSKFILLLLIYLFQVLVVGLLILTGFFSEGTRIKAILLMSGSTIFGLTAALLIGNAISRQLTRIGLLLKKSDDGNHDLTQRVPVHQSDVTALLNRNINIFIAGLHNIVFRLKNIARISDGISSSLSLKAEETSKSLRQISDSMDAINENGQKLKDNAESATSSVEDIDRAIQGVAGQIEGLSAAITESSASVEQMVASIKNMSIVAEEKNTLSDKLGLIARKSEENMSETRDSIQHISQSTGAIEELVEVINGVAEQTNILAMNAAIEAAHAGESGRGFSVVAEEIRKLSEKTAENALSIGETLKDMTHRIYQTNDLTVETERSIMELTSGIGQVSNGMSEMTGSLEEMSAGTEQITIALNQLNTINQDVEEAIREITQQSSLIDTSMGQIFQLTGENAESFGNISEKVNRMVILTDEVSRLSDENAENIDIMDREIGNFTTIDKSSLKSTDGQPLLAWNTEAVEVPPRPGNPAIFAEDDERHWYDQEWGLWNIKKENLPDSPADGARGKRIIALSPMKHSYYDSWTRGMEKLAKAFGIELETMVADWTPQLQGQQVSQAIKKKPDLIILSPCSTEDSVEWFRKINKAGIPAVCSNIEPGQEAFKYLLAYTGVDNWGSYRSLAHLFAEKLNYEGGYTIVQHLPESTVFNARTYALLTELKKIAPKMVCLDKAPTNLNYEETLKKVDDWINKYGESLKGIISADDSETARGIIDAVEKNNREDIIRMCQGHSKIGLDFVQQGKLHAINLQSAETDGALPVEVAIDYFNGLDIQPIRFMPKGIITRENVEDYLPAQW